MDLQIHWLGRVPFEETWRSQEETVVRMAAADSPDELWLLEHDPVYTIGRTPDQSSLRDPSQLPHQVVQINRGGQATYHGPGQLVGYPLLNLRRYGQDLHLHLRRLEGVLIRLLDSYGVTAQRRAGLTGVWVEDRKIASIGVGVRHWISMHGFALNVRGSLDPFREITPCGIVNVEMTNLEREAGQAWSVEEVAERAGEFFRTSYTSE